MQDNNGRATMASEIEVPQEVVELRHLKAKDGSAVKVKVYPVSPLLAGRAGLALPGAIPKDVPDDQVTPEMRDREDSRNLALMLDMAGPIIEDCTALSGANGSEVKPAFYFSKESPGSLPGRILHAEDLSMLVAAAMRLAGYGVEVAESTSFRGGDGSGSGVGS